MEQNNESTNVDCGRSSDHNSYSILMNFCTVVWELKLDE